MRLNERTLNPLRALLALAVIGSSLTSARARAQLTYTEIAREWQGGLGWIDGDVPTALAENGLVAFAAHDTAGTVGVYHGDGGPLTGFDLAPSGIMELYEVDLDSDAHIALRGQTGPATFEGPLEAILTTDGVGEEFEVVHEGRRFALNPDPVAPRSLDMDEGGVFAFSSIRDGHGALMRGTIGGPLEVLRTGSGTFYNTQGADVNSAGTMVVQMEHMDPAYNQLRRGILLFDTPEQGITEIETALERVGIGVQPNVAISENGTVAFSLNVNVTVRHYDPPFDASGPPISEVTLAPGVYVATPAPMGEPSTYTQIANASGGYASFGRVQINDAGTVVFQATRDNGENGIYSGPSPDLDKIVQTGEFLIGAAPFVSYIVMGELNEAGELSMLTSDWYSVDYQIWRVGGITTCRGLCDFSRRLRACRGLRCLRELLFETCAR